MFNLREPESLLKTARILFTRSSGMKNPPHKTPHTTEQNMGAAESAMSAACCAQEPKSRGDEGLRKMSGLEPGGVPPRAPMYSPTVSPTTSTDIALLTPSSAGPQPGDEAIQHAKSIMQRQTLHSFVSKYHVRSLNNNKAKAKQLEGQLMARTEELRALNREDEVYRHRMIRNPVKRDVRYEQRIAAQRLSVAAALRKAETQMRECMDAADHAEEQTVRGGGGNTTVPAFFRANRSVDSSQSQEGPRSKSPSARTRGKK